MLRDEPFSALDALRRLSAQVLVTGCGGPTALAVLLVAHDVEEAQLLATRVVVLVDGRGGHAVCVDQYRPDAGTTPDSSPCAETCWPSSACRVQNAQRHPGISSARPGT